MRIQHMLLVLVMLVSATASANKKKKDPKLAAKAHMEKAAVASQENRHEDALKELDAAYALDPQPMLLLARGHVYVKLEKCEDAIKLYEEYLATNPAQDLADMTTAAIETCKATLAPPPEEPPPVETPPPAPVTHEELNKDAENPTLETAHPVVAQPAAQVDASSGPTWFKDPILIGLGAGAVLSAAAGVVLYTSARGKIDEADAAMSYEEWSSRVDDARSLRLYSILGGAAGALFVGGAVFYYLRTYRGDDDPQVTVTPTRGGGVVGWGGTF